MSGSMIEILGLVKGRFGQVGECMGRQEEVNTNERRLEEEK